MGETETVKQEAGLYVVFLCSAVCTFCGVYFHTGQDRNRRRGFSSCHGDTDGGDRTPVVGIGKPYISAAIDCERYKYPKEKTHLLPDDWMNENEKTVWDFYVNILEKHADELTMKEVDVKKAFLK